MNPPTSLETAPRDTDRSPAHRLPARSVAVVLGTRPEIIKLAGIIEILGPAARVIHTGQHYDHRLGAVFFEELGLAPPDVQFEVGGRSRGTQIGEAIRLLDAEFEAHRPVAVVVQGDTNATVAGALAANAREIPLVHVEAGLRSFDRAMPEEHNRIVTDCLSDLCCAPTDVTAANLAAEGIPAHRVVITGNPVVEAVERLLPGPERRASLMAELGVEPARFALATFHRPENVDVRDMLATILGELAALPIPVVLPLHPRTAARAREFGLDAELDRIRVVEPLGSNDFLGLAAECALMVSDSGGVQEEASVVKRPVVVVRNSTERPEVQGTFARLVSPGPMIGETANAWLDDIDAVHRRLAALPSPYGDGTASQQIVDAIHALVQVGS